MLISCTCQIVNVISIVVLKFYHADENEAPKRRCSPLVVAVSVVTCTAGVGVAYYFNKEYIDGLLTGNTPQGNADQ